MHSDLPSPETRPLDGLLAGLRLALGTGRRRDGDTLRRVADWQAVARLATYHRVVTLFLNGSRSAGVPLADEAVAADLARRRMRQFARGRRQIEAMRQATASLADRGIPALVLKGLPLGQRLYGSPFAKTSTDIDLLVSPECFTAADRTLRERGWQRLAPAFRETPARARAYFALEKEHVFGGPGGLLELHRRLLRNPYLFDAPFASLQANSATVEIEGHAFRTLGDADQLLYLACHGSLHYWQRLKWLCDFGALLACVDGEAVEQAVARGRSQRLDGVIAAALVLGREALGVEPPPATGALRARDPRTRFIAALSRRTWTPRSGVRSVVREAAMRLGRLFIGSGMRYALREASRNLMQPHDFGTVDLPDRLFWLYVPLRPVLWMLRALRRRGRE